MDMRSRFRKLCHAMTIFNCTRRSFCRKLSQEIHFRFSDPFPKQDQVSYDDEYNNHPHENTDASAGDKTSSISTVERLVAGYDRVE